MCSQALGSIRFVARVQRQKAASVQEPFMFISDLLIFRCIRTVALPNTNFRQQLRKYEKRIAGKGKLMLSDVSSPTAGNTDEARTLNVLAGLNDSGRSSPSYSSLGSPAWYAVNSLNAMPSPSPLHSKGGDSKNQLLMWKM